MHSSNPLITVITPVHNEQEGIKRAIESVIAQTYTNWEMIIINDASTDKTASIVKEYIKKDKRIKLEDLKKNVGGSACRNIGIKKAKGDYLTLLDGDDEFLPKKLEELLKFANEAKNKDSLIISDYFEERDMNLKEIVISSVRKPIYSLLTMDWHVASGSNLFICKKQIKEVGLYNEKYPRHQDIEFLIRCLQKFNIVILHKPLTIIHGHKMQMGPKIITSEDKIKKIIEAKLMLFSDFKDEISKFSKTERKRIYAKNWLQISRLYALAGNTEYSIEYLNMSLDYGIVFSNNNPLLPYITYFSIPIYLFKSTLARLFKK